LHNFGKFEKVNEKLALSLCRWYYFKNYTEFHSTKLWLKHASTAFYYNVFRNERVKGIVKLTASHFSHSSHCEVPNTRCLPVQHARIPLQVKYCLQHLTLRAKFTKSLNKSCHSLSFGSIKLMCLKVSGAALEWVIYYARIFASCCIYMSQCPDFRQI